MRGGDTSSGFSPGTVDVASGPRTTEEEGLAGRSASVRQGGRGARGRPRFRGETARSAGGPGDRMDGRDALGVCDPERGETARAAAAESSHLSALPCHVNASDHRRFKS